VVYTCGVVIAERSAEVVRYVTSLADRLGPGAALPGERELAATCGVSRMTVRHALDDLAHRRVVERRHGAGTFVRRPSAAQPLSATSFHEDMARRGYVGSSRLLSSTTAVADTVLAAQLEMPGGEGVLVVRRLRLADDEPMALETLHVPAARVPGLTGADLAGDASYYGVLRERYGRRVTTGRQTVAPAVLGADDAALLGVTAGAPALRFVRVSRDQDGQVVELVDALYRGDRYLIEIDIQPPRGSSR
jgi:GntR family transcriptional regulator